MEALLRVLREPSVRGRRLSGMLHELQGGIQGGAQNGTAPTKMLIRLEGVHGASPVELSTFEADVRKEPTSGQSTPRPIAISGLATREGLVPL